MRLCVVTDEISQDLSVALRIMADYGIREAELRSVFDESLIEASEVTLDRVAAALNGFDMTVSCIATQIFKCDLGGSKAPLRDSANGSADRGAADQMQLLQRAIDMCKRFGADYLRVFSFQKQGRLSPEIEDRIADALVRPAEVAARAGVTLVLENERGCYLGTGKETARVIEKVGAPSLKMLWDPGNAFMAGEQPFPSGYQAAQKHIAHIHVKDARASEEGRLEWTLLGDGQIDYAGQFLALKDASFAGAVSLETHYRGSDGNQEEASRLCLERMVRLASVAA